MVTESFNNDDREDLVQSKCSGISCSDYSHCGNCRNCTFVVGSVYKCDLAKIFVRTTERCNKWVPAISPKSFILVGRP